MGGCRERNAWGVAPSPAVAMPTRQTLRGLVSDMTVCTKSAASNCHAGLRPIRRLNKEAAERRPRSPGRLAQVADTRMSVRAHRSGELLGV